MLSTRCTKLLKKIGVRDTKKRINGCNVFQLRLLPNMKKYPPRFELGWILFDAAEAANPHNAALYTISRKNNGKSVRQTGS